MTIRNKTLKSKLGIEFEFKNSLVPYLSDVLDQSAVSSYNVAGNTPSTRQASVDKLGLVGSTMGFEYKAAAYRAFKLIDDAILNSLDVSQGDKDEINMLTMLVSRYVGMEGDGDFHFMVASYKLAEAISQALDISDDPLLAFTPMAPLSEPVKLASPDPVEPVIPEPEPEIVEDEYEDEDEDLSDPVE